MTEPRPKFATNRGEETVGEAIRGHIEWVLDTWKKPFEVAIATAYFNPEGFHMLAEALARVSGIRLLLGAEPDGRPRGLRKLDQDTPPQHEERARVRRALQGHRRSIEEDRDLLGFDIKADERARRLVKFLKTAPIEVRRYESGFLHGKAFVVTTDDEGVISGSSNLTAGGLARNLELNLGHYEPDVVERVREWFDELWEDAVPFDLASIYEARYEPHNPYTIYLRMLLERYGSEIEAEFAGAKIHLTTFQQDGLWRAWRYLEKHHGVLIADGVGLGKTYLAGEMIREVVQDRRQRVLLISPASLRDGPWRHFLAEHMLGVESISFEQLSDDRQANPGKGTASHIKFPVNEYAMVVIDESHAYRNPDTERAATLRRLLQGTPPKDLVLLTATPVNNSLWDLYYLLSYFIRNDATFADRGVRSLRDHFRDAMAVDPSDLSPDRLFDILDDVAVRRTRHFVKRYYQNDHIYVDGLLVPIQFPKPQVLKVTYDLDEVLPGFFERFAHALDCADGECDHAGEVAKAPVLELARYVPSTFLGGSQPEPYELQLAGLLRSGLLKRFESSAHAFARTCERMAAGHDAFLDLLDKGLVGTGKVLGEWMATDTEEADDLIERFQEDLESAEGYWIDELRASVESDRDLLRSFAKEASSVTPNRDPKLGLLCEELAQIADQAKRDGLADENTREKRKVVVFTYFADTAEWIEEHIRGVVGKDAQLAAYRGRVVATTGRSTNRQEALFGFAPRTTYAPPGSDEDRYDVLVTTDVLAEGINLQQARHVINYDLPWNPMRLVQRHGRIDRIGSPHEQVWIRCVFPDAQLDAILGLEERLHRKIAQAAASVGVDQEPLPGAKTSELTFADTRADIEKLRAENPELFENAGERGGAHSGEEYRQELRSALENKTLADDVRRLPWGSGSGMARNGAMRGYVFCARVADHPDAVFRYVAFGEDGQQHVVGETLTCLAHAAATSAAERVLDEETHRGAYEAWDAARSDIFEQWQLATDPANLQPTVPKVMREAAQLLREHPPPEMSQGDVDRMVDAIEAPYGPRILAMMREALRSSDDPLLQSGAVAAQAGELGLEPSLVAQPLPLVSIVDVHLVCWMAIVPATSSAIRGEELR